MCGTYHRLSCYQAQALERKNAPATNASNITAPDELYILSRPDELRLRLFQSEGLGRALSDPKTIFPPFDVAVESATDDSARACAGTWNHLCTLIREGTRGLLLKFQPDGGGHSCLKPMQSQPYDNTPLCWFRTSCRRVELAGGCSCILVWLSGQAPAAVR